MELSEFPIDILFKIFSWLPVMDLLRLRCVSNLWLDIIDDSSFRHMHAKHDVEEARLLILDTIKIAPKVLHDIDDDYWRVSLKSVSQLGGGSRPILISSSSCKGLLFFLNRTKDEFLLFNPVTQEGISVPVHAGVARSGYDCYGIGYDSMSKRYKIVHVSRKVSGGINFRMTAHVHTVGTSCWREIELPPRVVIYWEGIFSSGAIFWIAYTKDLQDRIACFDLEKEEFTFIANPSNVPAYELQLADLRGSLGFFKRSRDHILDIWVLKDLQKQKWEKKYRIDFGLWIRDSDTLIHRRNTVQVFGLKLNGHVLLRIDDNHYSWDPQTTWLENIEPVRIVGTMIVFHVGSLVPLLM